MFEIKTKLINKWLQLTKNHIDYNFELLNRYQQITRPHYAYSMINAAKMAQRLGYSKVSICEYGVASGNGLLVIEYLAEKIEKHLNDNLTFVIYGFDTGEGLPELEGVEDLPY